MKAVQSLRLKELGKDADVLLKRHRAESDSFYYYAVKRGDVCTSYLGSENSAKLNAVREYRYYNHSIKRISDNISAIESALKRIKATDYESINKSLPAMYKNPQLSVGDSNSSASKWKEKAEALKSRYEIYRPEELTIKTDDGNYVRSKSEGMIYNYLLTMGVPFVYELPLRLGRSTVFPDFTLLSEIDSSTEIIIEHQGMMGNDYYRNRFSDKVYRYLQDGYVPGINILFTFDGLDGSLDITPIEDLVMNHIKSC